MEILLHTFTVFVFAFLIIAGIIFSPYDVQFEDREEIDW